MNKIKAIIFDIDGVLVDVSNSYREAIKQTAEFFLKGNIEPNEINELKQKTGFNNDWDLTEALIQKRGLKIPKEKIIAKFQELYLGSGGKGGLIGNEAWLLNLDFLKNLSKEYEIGILTGRPKEEAFIPLKKSNSLKYFKSIIAMEDCGNMGKPNPFGLKLVLKELEITNKEESIYVGDTPDDMRCAINAGIIPIGCLPPKNKSSELKDALTKAGARVVLNEVNEIIRVI